MSLPQVSHPRILWVHDYWDGPLSGMCEHECERLWFAMVEESRDEHRYRTYHLYRLTPFQMAWHEHWHAEFTRHVSKQWEWYLPPEERVVHPRDKHAKFYVPYEEAKKNEPKVDASQAIAWFDDRPVHPKSRPP